MYESMYTVPGTNALGWLQGSVYPYMKTQKSRPACTPTRVHRIPLESPAMPKKTPLVPDAADATSPKKDETSKVIQLHITPYFNSLIRAYIFYNTLTNRHFLDLSIQCILSKLEDANANEKTAVFSLYPKFKDGTRFSAYATKSLLDELERNADDYGIPYQASYYSALVAYTKDLIESSDANMIKALKEAKEKHPDLADQFI